MLGHGGAGKTTLAEAMLFVGGASDRLGRVEDGNTVLDFDPEEKRRRASVSSAVASAEWKNAKPVPDLAAQLSQPGNLVRNGSFEVDSDSDLMPNLWTANYPFTVGLTEEQTHSGRFSLKITSEEDGFTPLAVQRGLDTKGDQAYVISSWAKTSAPGVEFRIYVEWHLGDRYLGAIGPWTKGTGDWQKVAVNLKTTPDPQGGAYVVVQLRGKGSVYFDDVAIEEAK